MKKAIKFIEYCHKNSIPVLDRLPDGWKYNEQATTAPSGYKWANNEQPLFTRDADGNYYGNPNYQHAVIKVN